MRQYIGIFNYFSQRKKMNLIKMISYSSDINQVISDLLLNMKQYNKLSKDYHIGIYEDDENGIPVKIDHILLDEII